MEQGSKRNHFLVPITTEDITAKNAANRVDANITLTTISTAASNTLDERKSSLVFEDSINGSCVFKLNTVVDMCKRGGIMVDSIPNEEKKNATLGESTEKIKGEEIKLKLTPPIITAWTYQLANSLHKGK